MNNQPVQVIYLKLTSSKPNQVLILHRLLIIALLLFMGVQQLDLSSIINTLNIRTTSDTSNTTNISNTTNTRNTSNISNTGSVRINVNDLNAHNNRYTINSGSQFNLNNQALISIESIHFGNLAAVDGSHDPTSLDQVDIVIDVRMDNLSKSTALDIFSLIEYTLYEQGSADQLKRSALLYSGFDSIIAPGKIAYGRLAYSASPSTAYELHLNLSRSMFPKTKNKSLIFVFDWQDILTQHSYYATLNP